MIYYTSKCFTFGATIALAGLALTACGGSGDDHSQDANSPTQRYGSIAYVDSGTSFSIASVSSSSSQGAANGDAIARCGKPGCAVILEFTDCGSAVVGKTANRTFVWGAASGATAEEAHSAANSVCSQKGGLGCSLSNLPPACNAH